MSSSRHLIPLALHDDHVDALEDRIALLDDKGDGHVPVPGLLNQIVDLFNEVLLGWTEHSLSRVRNQRYGCR